MEPLHQGRFRPLTVRPTCPRSGRSISRLCGGLNLVTDEHHGPMAPMTDDEYWSLLAGQREVLGDLEPTDANLHAAAVGIVATLYRNTDGVETLAHAEGRWTDEDMLRNNARATDICRSALRVCRDSAPTEFQEIFTRMHAELVRLLPTVRARRSLERETGNAPQHYIAIIERLGFGYFLQYLVSNTFLYPTTWWGAEDWPLIVDQYCALDGAPPEPETLPGSDAIRALGTDRRAGALRDRSSPRRRKAQANRAHRWGPRPQGPIILGGAEGTRTPDPHTASVVRYQLRHSPETQGNRPAPRTEPQSYMRAAGPKTGYTTSHDRHRGSCRDRHRRHPERGVGGAHRTRADQAVHVRLARRDRLAARQPHHLVRRIQRKALSGQGRGDHRRARHPARRQPLQPAVRRRRRARRTITASPTAWSPPSAVPT